MSRIFKSLKKLVKYFFIVFFVILAALTIMYNYTYVNLTPSASDVKFVKTRLGPISVEVPENFSRPFPARPDHFTSSIVYKDYTFRLTEYKYENEGNANENFRKNSEKIFPHVTETINTNLFDFIEYNTILTTPNFFPSLSSDYQLNIYLDNGIVALSSTVEGKDVEERDQTFRNRVINFFKYYIWQEVNDNTDIGFKTIFGIIKPNNDFYIHCDISYIFPAPKSIDGIRLFFQFNNTRNKYIQYGDNLVGIDKFIYFTRLRFYYFDSILTGFRWTLKQKNIKLAPSFSGLETVAMAANRKHIPAAMWLNFSVFDKANADSYFNFIQIRLYIDNDKLQNLPDYNVIFGYWEKIINSVSII
ncbi:MAG: hypothetical protein LBP22_05780 [Deltaproteobacteria bacterium]|jgi:hypothetical protein|nr:hypothetical protein [Deltaproteobacteria bacterium]